MNPYMSQTQVHAFLVCHEDFTAFYTRTHQASHALAAAPVQELELLVCGGSQLDLLALEAATLYDDGYTKDSETINWFWEVRRFAECDLCSHTPPAQPPACTLQGSLAWSRTQTFLWTMIH